MEVIFWLCRSLHVAGVQVRGRLVHRRLRDYTCCTSTREAVTFMLTRGEMGEKVGWMCLVSFVERKVVFEMNSSRGKRERDESSTKEDGIKRKMGAKGENMRDKEIGEWGERM